MRYLGLFLFVFTIYLSGTSTWAQPLPDSEVQFYERSAKNPGDKEESDQPGIAVGDPVQPYNRGIFFFNDKLYFYLLKPVSKGYKAVIPERARVSVKNLSENINMPGRFFNCLLQGKLKEAGTEALRFTINSTVGVVGLFDPAKSMFHLKEQEEDFGQTLGKYGMGPGSYIEWPLLGSSSLRDTLGLIGDAALDPFTYLSLITPLTLIQRALDRINELSLDKDTYESMVEGAIDPYLAVQDAYIQNRNKKIKE